MATIYGKGRGKARSHPPKAEKPYWLKISPKEVEELVVKMAGQGMSSAKIGLVLRDNYGIPSVKVVTGKKIQQILKERRIEYDEERIVLEKKLERLKKHFEKNKNDKVSKRGIQLTESKLARLKKHRK